MTALRSLGRHSPADFHGGVVPEGTVMDDCPLWPPSKSFPCVWRTSHQAEVFFPYRNQRYQIFCQPLYPRAPACDPGMVNGLHRPWTWTRSKWPKNVGQWRMHSGGECQQQHCLNFLGSCGGWAGVGMFGGGECLGRAASSQLGGSPDPQPAALRQVSDQFLGAAGRYCWPFSKHLCTAFAHLSCPLPFQNTFFFFFFLQSTVANFCCLRLRPVISTGTHSILPYPLNNMSPRLLCIWWMVFKSGNTNE